MFKKKFLSAIRIRNVIWCRLLKYFFKWNSEFETEEIDTKNKTAQNSFWLLKRIISFILPTFYNIFVFTFFPSHFALDLFASLTRV